MPLTPPPGTAGDVPPVGTWTIVDEHRSLIDRTPALWWTRWFVLYFPRLAIKRLTCKHTVRYDGCGPCLTCASPWFRTKDLCD